MDRKQVELSRRLKEEDRRTLGKVCEYIEVLSEYGYETIVFIWYYTWGLLELPGGSEYLKDIEFDLKKAVLDAPKKPSGVPKRLTLLREELAEHILNLQHLAEAQNRKQTIEITPEMLREVRAKSRAAA